uniref:VWFD domain-containing protein n=1 Tax=Timema shepardi TaxID=629360 RepID=A0A7R9ARL6_TIMSH|nr:unnamed protein product [Timema shepardi]
MTEDPSKKLEAVLAGDVFSEVGVRADLVHGSEKKELVKVLIALTEDKFLKTTFSWSSENIQHLVVRCLIDWSPPPPPSQEQWQKEVSSVLKHLTSILIQLGKEAQTELTDLVTTLRKAQPNLKPYLQSYQQELKAIKEEVVNDKALKELSAFLLINDLLQLTLSKTGGRGGIYKVGRVVGKTFVQLRSEVKDFLDVLCDQFKSLPVADIIKEKYEELLKQLAELEIPVELWNVITEVTSAVKDTVPTPELRDLVEAIESYVNKELANILDKATLALRSLVQMIKLQIKGEAPGDVPSILGFKLPVSLDELFKIPRFFVAHFSPLAYLSSGDLPTLKELLVTYRPRLNPLDWVPPYKERKGLCGGMGIGRLWPTLDDLLQTVSVLTSPCPSGNGFVVDSQHFFTFDNRHFTFKGSCSYVLLQDVVDGNFTVVLDVDNGKFNSLLLADDKDSLELLADKSNKFKEFGKRFSFYQCLYSSVLRRLTLTGVEHTAARLCVVVVTLTGVERTAARLCAVVITLTGVERTAARLCAVVVTLTGVERTAARLCAVVITLTGVERTAARLCALLVNGERSEFPARQGLLSAWRRYHWANLKSAAGVLVYVDSHTDLIAVSVSGFYHGRTRGLLGTLSYEPADDLIKPDGQFATKESEFGNSWSVGQCKDVTGHSHHEHETVKSSECSDKFTRGSTLSLCFPLLNPAPFREACDHAVEEAAECKLVGGGNPVAVGDLFSVKAPQRSADIVVVVEQVTGSAELYKELVGPLVTTLTNELKSKGVTDVHFHLVGFGGDLSWPTHYTSSGEMTFNGKNKNLKFSTPAEPLPFDTRENKVRWFKHELEVELGLNPAGEAFREVLDYPFRAGASKAVLVVLGQSCELSQLSGVVSIHLVTSSYHRHYQGRSGFVLP